MIIIFQKLIIEINAGYVFIMFFIKYTGAMIYDLIILSIL
ncbi:TPA: RDD family protein, partial [Legionella pneumophila subsp. pneumophila]|nr:RDD family protein [Legionella pneumophila subsp. pneumophila]